MSAGRPFRRRLATGRRLVVSSPIRDESSGREKEGAVRRRLVAATGTCPCGATFRTPTDLAPGKVTVVAVEHESGCPAIEGSRP